MQILADLHEERSHRDLKPQNIMVAQSSNTGNRNKVTVKLVDFAASRKQSEGTNHTSYKMCDTQDGQIVPGVVT